MVWFFVCVCWGWLVLVFVFVFWLGCVMFGVGFFAIWFGWLVVGFCVEFVMFLGFCCGFCVVDLGGGFVWCCCEGLFVGMVWGWPCVWFFLGFSLLACFSCWQAFRLGGLVVFFGLFWALVFGAFY